MKQISDYVDARLKAWCIHCARPNAKLSTNRDHVPSKIFLTEPYPANLPVVPICMECNSSFSSDEEYSVAFLGAVLAGTVDPNTQNISGARRVLERNKRLRERIDRARTSGEDSQLIWHPELERINRVVLKNARGHAYFELGEPMLEDPSRVSMAPLETLGPEARFNFERVDYGGIWPEVGSRLLSRLLSGDDLVNGWIVVQEKTYRYAVTYTGAVIVRSIIFEYLATEVAWLNA